MFLDFWSYDAEYVEIFGASHLTFIAFCFAVIAFFIIRKDIIIKHQNKIRILFLSLLIFQSTVLMYGWYFFATPSFLSEGLPLHLCRLATLISIVYLLNGNKKLLDPICYFCIFALISFFYPMQIYNYSHASGISYIISHLMMVLVPLFAMITTDWFYSWQGYKRAVIWFTVYFPIALIANQLTGGNYFYQVKRPFFHSMNPVLFGVLSYVVTVGGFAIITYVLLYLKKIVVEKFEQKEKQANV